VIAAEGRVTEPRYFLIVRSLYRDTACLVISAKTPSSNCSNPHEALRSLEQWISKNGPWKKNDESWLVVDKDNWKDAQLNELRTWTSRTDGGHYKRGLALSDPKFEYWLLLHFEDTSAANSEDCTRKLKKHLPRYNKQIDDHDFSQKCVQQAISRARRRDGRGSGASTTVYKLVESILSCSES
jgi:hypothetical protein